MASKTQTHIKARLEKPHSAFSHLHLKALKTKLNLWNSHVNTHSSECWWETKPNVDNIATLELYKATVMAGPCLKQRQIIS